MRWPQAVIQSQDPSAWLFSSVRVAAGLELVVGQAGPAGVRGAGVAVGERVGVVHLQPPRVARGAARCAAAAIAGEDVGAQRCGQVGERAVVEQVPVDRIGDHAAERVRVAGEVAADLGRDGLPVEQAVPVGLAAQRRQVDDELHLDRGGRRCPVDVPGRLGGAQDPRGQRVRAARADQHSARVVRRRGEDLGVRGRPHRAVRVLTGRFGGVADLVGRGPPEGSQRGGVGVEGGLDRGDRGRVVDHAEIRHAVLELPRPHGPLLACALEARGCVGVVVRDRLRDVRRRTASGSSAGPWAVSPARQPRVHPGRCRSASSRPARGSAPR